MSGKAKGKRRAEAQAEPASKKAIDSDDDEELEFEDEFGDDFEEEEFVQEEDGEEGEEGAAGGSSMSKGDLMDMEAEDGVNVETEGRLWRAGDAIPEGEDEAEHGSERGRSQGSQGQGREDPLAGIPNPLHDVWE